MATTPSFFATPNTGVAQAPATNDSSLTAPTHVATLFTAGSNGSQVNEIDVVGVGTTVAGRLNVFLVRSSTYYLVYQFLITAVTPGTTQLVYSSVWLPGSAAGSNLILKSGDTLAISVMESGNESVLQVNCYGGDA